ncbi:protease, partial [Streptomyces cavourensis]|nr:protease [Streptomyces cavourensis]
MSTENEGTEGNAVPAVPSVPPAPPVPATTPDPAADDVRDEPAGTSALRQGRQDGTPRGGNAHAT